MNVNISEYLRNSNNRQNAYTVQPGDSLYKIAKSFGVTVEDLMNANNLQTTKIYPNQVLIISKSIPSGAMYFIEYVVRPDDTLEKISTTLNVPTEIIGKYNDVTKLILAQGQVLQIPGEYNTYVIEENDTLESVLTKLNVTLEEFIEANLANLLTPGTLVYYK